MTLEVAVCQLVLTVKQTCYGKFCTLEVSIIWYDVQYAITMLSLFICMYLVIVFCGTTEYNLFEDNKF